MHETAVLCFAAAVHQKLASGNPSILIRPFCVWQSLHVDMTTSMRRHSQRRRMLLLTCSSSPPQPPATWQTWCRHAAAVSNRRRHCRRMSWKGSRVGEGIVCSVTIQKTMQNLKSHPIIKYTLGLAHSLKHC